MKRNSNIALGPNEYTYNLWTSLKYQNISDTGTTPTSHFTFIFSKLHHDWTTIITISNFQRNEVFA